MSAGEPPTDRQMFKKMVNAGDKMANVGEYMVMADGLEDYLISIKESTSCDTELATGKVSQRPSNHCIAGTRA